MPAAASRIFPAERLPLLARYADLLATEGVVRGLVGPREVPRLWERHVLNCGLLAQALPRDARVADVGSGAGLPGLVLALARPDLRITLVEPLLRRTTFLQEVVDELALAGVVVRRDRADALHGVETFDVVTARAVAPLERLLGWCMPLVAPHGSLVAMKGASVLEEIQAAAAVLDRLGCAPPEVEELGRADDPDGIPQTRIVRVTWADPSRVSLRPSGGRSDSVDGGRRRRRHQRGSGASSSRRPGRPGRGRDGRPGAGA